MTDVVMWCRSCGTVTSDGTCDCTEMGQPELRDAIPDTNYALAATPAVGGALDWATAEIENVEAYKAENPDWQNHTRPARDVIASPGRNELADKLLDRWDANENESNPLANGKCIRLWIAELDAIHTALSAPEQPASPLRGREELADAFAKEFPSVLAQYSQFKIVDWFLAAQPASPLRGRELDRDAIARAIYETEIEEDNEAATWAYAKMIAETWKGRGLDYDRHAAMYQRTVNDQLAQADSVIAALSASAPEQPECKTEREAAIEECAALMRRWANDAAEQMASDPGCVIQHNVCRNAAVAISNLSKETP